MRRRVVDVRRPTSRGGFSPRGWLLFDLTGRNALVTGAGTRLGRRTAVELGRAGCNVVVHYHGSEEHAAGTAEEIRRGGTEAWTVRADLANPAAAEELFDRGVELAGPIDFLVNSASIFPEGTLSDLLLDTFFENLRVNALSPFALSQRLAGQRRPACIVNILDTRMLDYDRAHVPYHLSKRTLFDLTRMMSREYAPLVRVNAVAPGLILPPAGEDASYLRRMAATNPLNSHGTSDQIAKTVLFLIWNEFVTGQVIYVDGGRHLQGRFYGS